MAATVSEIMNREVFSVPPDEPAYTTLGFILSLGITAAPVVDDDGRVLGVVSMRDLVRAPAGARVADRMTRPALTLSADALIQDAARQLTEHNVHHMPVTDKDSKVVGFVGSVDLLRAVIGEPVRHPDTFPHYDAASGLSWTDEINLTEDKIGLAPDGPGRLELLHGAAGEPETILWHEAATNVRQRLHHILAGARNVPTSVDIAIQSGNLRFRAAPLLPDGDVLASRIMSDDGPA